MRMRRFNLFLWPDHLKRLAALAKRLRQSVSWLIRDAIEKYLAEHKS